MRVGFTGTRAGMAIDQWQTFVEKILDFEMTEWHDGDCVGADTQAHEAIRGFMREVPDFTPKLYGHPCNLDKYRAYNEYDFVHPAKAPLVRNRDIVQASDLMFAAPKEYEEVFRGSGTWATIRHTRLKKKRLLIIWPDGTLSDEAGEATVFDN